MAVLAPAGLSSAFDSGPSERVAIGVDEGLSDGFFLGAIDEVRVRLDARDTAWIEAQYSSLTDSLVSFGPVRTD